MGIGTESRPKTTGSADKRLAGSPDGSSARKARRTVPPAADPPWANQRRPRLRIWPFALVVLVAGGGYLILRPDSSANSISPSSYEVVRRSFSIVLEEKGTLKAAKSTNIICDIEGGGKILKLIPEGDRVEKGDFLVEFAGDKIEENLQNERARENEAQNALVRSQTDLATHEHESAKKIRAAQRALIQANMDLEKYEQADWPQQHSDAKVAVENANNEFERAEQKYQASIELREKEVITGPDLLEDKIAWVKAKAEKEKAELALHSITTYTHPKDQDEKEAAGRDAEEELAFAKKSTQDTTRSKQADIEAKTMALQLVQERIKRLESQMSKTTITAPGPGIVAYGDADHPWQRDDIGEGKTVWKGNVVMQIPDLTVMLAVVQIHESKSNQVKIGQVVEVEGEGTGDRVFLGKVIKIGALPSSGNRWLNPDVKEYETEIKLEGENLPLHPGGTAKVRIAIENVEDVLCVPLPAVYSKGRSHFVFKEDGSLVVPHEVTVGRANDIYVEITTGLEEGDRVRLAVDSTLVALLPEVEEDEATTRRAIAEPSTTEQETPKVATSDEAPEDDGQAAEDLEEGSGAVGEAASASVSAADKDVDTPADG